MSLHITRWVVHCLRNCVVNSSLPQILSFLWFSAHLCNVTNKFKVGIWLRNGARRASRNVTVHRLSAYSQDLLFTARLHDSRLYQAKRAKICCAHHPCIDRPILCCLLSQHTHNPSWSTMGLHFAHGGGADWLLYLAGFTALHHDVPVMSCLQGWSVSMTSDINACTLGNPKSYTDEAAE